MKNCNFSRIIFFEKLNFQLKIQKYKNTKIQKYKNTNQKKNLKDHKIP